MKSLISDLWNGEFAPSEHCGVGDIRANQLYGKMQQCRQMLLDQMGQEAQVGLERYGNLSEDYWLYMMELAFRDGFITGNRLAQEIYLEA